MHLTKAYLLSIGTSALLLSSVAHASNYSDTNLARMQAMDKITGRVSEIDIPVNGEMKFGSFSIVIRRCIASSPEETPENIAFVDVADNYNSDTPVNIFKGWMYSSSPALNAVEHPIYDVWLLKCLNGNPNPQNLLSAEELSQRDNLVSTQNITENKAEIPSPINEQEVPIGNKDIISQQTDNSPQTTTPEVISVVVSADEKEKDSPKQLFQIEEQQQTIGEDVIVSDQNVEENGFEEEE